MSPFASTAGRRPRAARSPGGAPRTRLLDDDLRARAHRGRRLLALALASSVVGPAITLPAQGAPASLRVAVVRPGGGVLVADGESVVPLEIVVEGASGPLKAIAVRASAGRILRTERGGATGIRFAFAMPREDALAELEVDLLLADGTSRREAYPLVLSPPSPPELVLELTPDQLPASRPEPVRVAVRAVGEGMEGVDAKADGGTLVLGPPDQPRTAPSRVGWLELPEDLPVDAPSHLQVLAVATSQVGWGAVTRGLSLVAPVRIEAAIPRRWRLQVEGAEAPVRGVRAPRSGPAVLEGVPIRYGAEVRVFRTRGRRKRELSVPLPAGRIPVGVVAALPDQAWADGGVGPTLAVALPPDPFGGPPTWPELEVRGARLVAVHPVGPDVRVLVLERPSEPGPVRVLVGGLPAGTVELRPGRGRTIALQPEAPRPGERAAAAVTVRDGRGRPTSARRPSARLLRGDPVPLTPLGPGRWRAAVPAEAPGAIGEAVRLRVELPPPPVVVGDSLSASGAELALALAGPPPGAPLETGTPAEPQEEATPWLLGACAFGGGTPGGLVRAGLGVIGGFALPVLERRLGLRLGAELAYARGEPEITFAQGSVTGLTQVTGLVIPVELAIDLFRSAPVDLRARVGGSVRFEAAVLDVDESSAGGSGRWSGGLRAGMEGELAIAPRWGLTVGVLVDGLATSGEGFSTDDVAFEGSLYGVRGEVGVRTRLPTTDP